MGEKSLTVFIISIISLLGLGIVMLLSTSVFISERSDIYHDVNRQAIWLGMGIVLCAVTALIDYHFWYKSRWFWFIVSISALILCFVALIYSDYKDRDFLKKNNISMNIINHL